MGKIEHLEVDALYEYCGLLPDDTREVKGYFSNEKLNNKLNTDFSSIYGEIRSNNFSGTTSL